MWGEFQVDLQRCGLRLVNQILGCAVEHKAEEEDVM